jgi:putative DNA primase/helicase
LSSPIKAFVEDCCDFGPTKSVTKESLYAAYKSYCEKVGSRPLAHNTFGTKLHAAIPALGQARPQRGGERLNEYTGIDLKPEQMRMPF